MSTRIERISFDGPNLIFQVNRDRYVVQTSRISDRLAAADQSVREKAELLSGGYTVHWPQLDLQMSASGMMQMGRRYYA